MARGDLEGQDLLFATSLQWLNFCSFLVEFLYYLCDILGGLDRGARGGWPFGQAGKYNVVVE